MMTRHVTIVRYNKALQETEDKLREYQERWKQYRCDGYDPHLQHDDPLRETVPGHASPGSRGDGQRAESQ